MERRPASWDKSAFVREPLDRTLCRPRPSGSGSGENHSAAQDHDRLGGQRGAPAGGGSHAAGMSHFWAIRPPCMSPTSSCGNFAVRQSSPGTVDSWACEMAATNSNVNNGSDFARKCPSFRDAPDSGSDSDASMDAEVASLTSGRRLGMDHKDASLLLGPRCAVRAGYMPVVTPPSRSREAESVEAFFALLSPTAEQQCSSSSNVSSSSITPSPTDGYSTPAAGHLELGRSAVFSLGGRGDDKRAGDSGRAGVVQGEGRLNERGAKRQRFGASASSAAGSTTHRCKKSPI